MAQQLRALAILPKDESLVPDTHMVAHNLVPRDQMPFAGAQTHPEKMKFTYEKFKRKLFYTVMIYSIVDIFNMLLSYTHKSS